MTLPYETTSGVGYGEIYDDDFLFLLLEDGGYILLETSGRIILELSQEVSSIYETTSGNGSTIIYEEETS
jgi:hypothetical protein